jgi:hypothetical protein
MDSGKTVIVFTDTWTEWKPGTTEISIWTKKANSYSTSDLTGTWEINSLASGPGAPWWLRGTTVGSNGFFSGMLQEYNSGPDSSSCKLDISSNGIITSQDFNPDFRAVMDSGKTVIVFTDTWTEWKPGTTYISIWLR